MRSRSVPDLVFSPNLVTKVEIGQKNPFRLTYYIRPEARWSDGVPITASDFLFTYRLRHLGQAQPCPTWARPSCTRRSGAFVIARSRRRSRRACREPFAAWRALFRVVLPRHVLAGEDLATSLARLDRRSEDRPADRQRAVSDQWSRDRPAADSRPKPAVLGTAHQLCSIVIVLRNPASTPATRSGPFGGTRSTSAVLGAPAPARDHAHEIARLPGWRVVTWPA